MIERIARAMAPALFGANGSCEDVTAVVQRARDVKMAEARAVLQAMREPTPGMVEAMLTALNINGLDDVFECDVLLCWRAGIDAALAEREAGR